MNNEIDEFLSNEPTQPKPEPTIKWQPEYKVIPIDKLTIFNRRDIRPDIITKLTERIKEGYNPGRPLTVVNKGDYYLVADGNHRLKVCEELNIKEVPCLIRNENEYTLSIKCNNDEDTYAPEDLFDTLNTIQLLKEQGLTQEKIGEIIGLSKSMLSNYYSILNKMSTTFINLCKSFQKGRVDEKSTSGEFNFTERWFRDSGLYELQSEFQLQLINNFINDKFNWNKTKVQQTSQKFKLYQEMIELTKEIQDQEKQPEIIEQIKKGIFNSIPQLRKRIEELNENAKNKLICGDCLIELEKLPDNTIDVVLTDPPYGMDYKSNVGKYNDSITKTGVLNDSPEEAIELFEKTCKLLNQKTKPDAHLYFFINWNNYSTFRSIAEKYFTIKTSLVWYKQDGGIGDLQYDWINGTELVIYCIKGHKPINKRRVNVLQYPKLHSSDMIHPTQKPIELLTEILSVSANKYDVVCDPFMGSGSAIKAAKNYGCNYIGIELDRETFNKAINNINN